MPNLSIAQAVENARNADEATVVALIDHLVPILENWRRAEDLRNQLPRLDSEIGAYQARMAADKPALESIRAQRDAVYRSPGSYGSSCFAGVGLGAVLLVVWLFIHSGWLLMPGLLALGAGLAIGYARANGIHTELTVKMVALEKQLADGHSSLEQLAKNRAAVDAEINARSGGFPQVKVANVRFGMSLAKVDGLSVLLDTSGCTPQTVLRAVDVSALQEGLSHISSKAQALLSVPPMLAPGERVPDVETVEQLFGEERELQDLVGEFTLNLGRLRDVSLSLPVVPNRNVLVRRLTSTNPQKSSVRPADTRPAVEISRGNISRADIASFVQEVNQTKERGQHVFSELRTVFRNLEDACLLYANARTSSINTVHQNLTEVLNRATWCGRRFYCPRTILSPKYLQDLLGIDPEQAYLLSLDDLVERLRGDPEIARRLDEKRELQDQLSDAYHNVQSFMGSDTFDENGHRMSDRQPKYLEDQFLESVKLFISVLTRVMTGSSYPVLNFSAEARVFFDPHSDEWRSDVAPHTYSTPDILKYGGVVKAYSDLMLPLWEHLWTEKADFRKSELFRTNESMIRMSEKESEKLIEIGNQFRADMRSIRENVNLLESDLQSKHTEILSFRDGMNQLGLLSDRVKEAVSDTKLQGIVIGEPVLPKMVQYERLLGGLPQAQAENRGTVHDPIDLVREPDALISVSQNVGARLLSI